MANRILLRRDTAQNWSTRNPTLGQGEVGWEIGTQKFKIGDGSTAWNSLSYIRFGEDPTFANLQGNVADNAALVAAFAGKEDTISDLSTIRSGAGLGATSLQQSDIVNNTTSSATNKALAAAIGKSLQEQINNLNTRGKYLSIWDCTTGLAMDEPPVNPYTIETGSYFIVGKIASAGGTNYRPNGGTYDKDVPSTTVETENVQLNATYYWDGTQWRLVEPTVVGEVSFASLQGQPTDNTNLANALSAKQDEIEDLDTIRSQAGSALQSGDNISELNNDAGYLTGITSQQVTTALGYTPYSNSNPSGYQTNVLEGVQVNGDDLTIDVNKKVNIPLATTSTVGVVGLYENYGIKRSSNSQTYIAINKATNEDIVAKTSQYKPIVPSSLDKAVAVGITTNSTTLTNTEQGNARNWIGASQVVMKDYE